LIYLKLFLRDAEVKSWIEAEDIKVSSILMILKKSLGYKNQTEIIRKTDLDSSFLRIKLCWRTDQEYTDLLYVLNGIVGYFISTSTSTQGNHNFYRGRTLLDFIDENGRLTFIPYYKTLEEDGPKSLMYWTLEKTIERWIKEKF
jgi:hypothetical protein